MMMMIIMITVTVTATHNAGPPARGPALCYYANISIVISINIIIMNVIISCNSDMGSVEVGAAKVI